MRIWTKCVYEWVDGALKMVPEESASYEYEGPIASCDPVTIGSTVGSALLVNALTGSGPSQGAQQAGGTSTYAADTAANISKDQWDYFKQHYQPLESNLIDQVKAAGSPEEVARATGTARADVAGAFDQARKQSLSRMQSYGINPGSPAFQSAAASTDIAEGAATAGAETTARNNVRNLAYSKALDVVGLGRNIPAQSAASAANAANAATSASRNLFNQNQTMRQATGYAVQPIVSSVGKAVKDWFSTPSSPNYTETGWAPSTFKGDTTNEGFSYEFNKGGRIGRYAKGGIVMKHPITPHMKMASGGGVGRQGLQPPDRSNMGATIDNETGQVVGPGTETSDSIPAQIDGQKPAALSTGEFVMNAEVPKLSGDEILTAINQAGLKKRQRAGISPSEDETMDSNDVSPNAGEEAYATGGHVGHRTVIYSGAGLGERNA